MKILIPLDGSPLAESVLPHVCDLVNQPSDAILIRIAPPIEEDMMSEGRAIPVWEQRQSIESTYLRYLEKAGQKLLGSCFKVSCQVLFGKPSKEILTAARQHSVDIIAMATHGRQGLSRLVHGSVAAEVLEEAHVPVVLFMAPKDTKHSVDREPVV